MLKFTSYTDLSNTLRNNIWKIPHDIDCIVGVPRSGMLVAIMLSEYLNIPVKSLQDYINNAPVVAGGRGVRLQKSNFNRVLILDDTVYSGSAMKQVREKLLNIHPEDEKIFACIYAEGEYAHEKVDLYLERNYCPNLDFYHLYEWNIFHHGNRLTTRTMFDMDGVLCKNPPDERNIDAYEAYLSVAEPMILPSTKIGCIATYRLNKYRDVTERWLAKNNVIYDNLYMTNGYYESRRILYSPSHFKANKYKESNCILFIESDPKQAYEIFIQSGKPIYCVENGLFYS